MERKYIYLITLFISVIILTLLLIDRSSNNLGFYNKSNTSKICFNKECITLEIAKTIKERENGLMFRKELENNSGMLFIFDKQKNHSFWMKNTLIPLDLIGLDKNFIITDIVENFQPCDKDPCDTKIIKNSLYVLEINAGVSKLINLKIGNKGELSYKD